MSFSKDQFFKRQTTLSEIGKEGQDLLQKSKVIIIGCGGLGSPIAVQLAASGVGAIHLVDFDTVTISNLHRQFFYKVDDVGKPKSETLAKFIEQRAPFTNITFTNDAVNKSNIVDLIKPYDIVVDGTDSLPIKYLVNDACVLHNKPLIYGSLYKFDGYVATFNLKDDKGNYSCNLRDAFPKMATDIPNCEEAGTLNTIVGLIATLQANEVIKIITATGKPLINQLLICNSLQNSQLKIKLKSLHKNHAESVKIITEIFDAEDYLDATCQLQEESVLITALELKDKLAHSSNNLKIISVINNSNVELPFKVDYKISLMQFDISNINFDANSDYVIICRRGILSYTAAKKIKEVHPNLNVVSLVGGIDNY